MENNSLIPLMQNGLDSCLIEYEEVKAELKKLFGNYNKLELEVNALKTPFHKIYHKLKKKFLRNNEPSIEDLIGIQQKIIRGLRKNLEQQTLKSEKSLVIIQNYSDNLDNRICDYLKDREEKKYNIQKTNTELIKHKSELSNILKSTPEYYTKRNKVKGLIRNYKLNSASYTRTNEAIRDNLMIVADITYREEIISLSNEQAKSITEASKRYEEFLGVVRCAYSDFIKQNKLYSALFSSIKRSKDFITELDNIVLSGQKDITLFADKLNNQKHYTNNLIEEVTTDITSSYENSKENIELDVEYRLGN